MLEYLLALRDIKNKEQFLKPSLTDIHSWRELHDAPSAVEIILDAIKTGKKIFIHGDFDCDGVCATSILWNFLYRVLKADVLPYIPSRFDEGYGLSEESIQAMLEQGAQLVITVDCGVKDAKLVKKYSKQGLDFIITDHHTLPSEDKLPEAKAVVHPRYPNHNYPFPEICGAAVAWKLVCGLNEITNSNYDVHSYLDLVALATVCDVMPLVDENRIFVAAGLQRLANTDNPGLLALMQSASVAPGSLDTYHFGFVLGPRLNAAGRLDSALEAVRLLTTSSHVTAKQYAQKLQTLNLERQQLTQKFLAEAEAQVANLGEQPLYFVFGDNWPEGIVGLIAGKLTEKYHRPVLIGSRDGDMIKASARSISGFHVTNALQQLSHLLERFGGHELAAGFGIRYENVDTFSKEMLRLASAQLQPEDLERQLPIDAVLTPADLSPDLVSEIQQLKPFGFGNATPTFALSGIEISQVRHIGRERNHLLLSVSEIPDFEIIGFNKASDYNLMPSDVINVAGSLDTNEWNGQRKIQMKLKDVEAA